MRLDAVIANYTAYRKALGERFHTQAQIAQILLPGHRR